MISDFCNLPTDFFLKKLEYFHFLDFKAFMSVLYKMYDLFAEINLCDNVELYLRITTPNPVS